MRIDGAGAVTGLGRAPARRDGLGRFVSQLAWNVVLALAIGAVAAIVVS